MELLLTLDRQLFFFINHLPHMAVSNAVALAISGVGTAGIIWFILAAALFLKEEKKDHWFFMPVLLAGGASWTVVELVLKPLVGRIRPSDLLEAIIVGSGADGYSFPSGHATIAWALATVLAHKEPKYKLFFFILAFLISFSRIYIGKHYPLDVISGAVIGWGIGQVSVLVTRPLSAKNEH